MSRTTNIFLCFLMLTVMIDGSKSSQIMSGIPRSVSPFQDIISQLKKKGADLPTMPNSSTNPKSDAQCQSCRDGLNFLLYVRRATTSDDNVVKEIAVNVCVNFGVYHKEVCDGLINLNWDTLTYVVANQPNLDVDMMCRFLLSNPSCEANNDIRRDWQIEIDDRRPKATEISDLHYDPNYEEGAPTVCGEPACCRIKQGKAEKPEEAAGKWGDYRDCDTPWIAIVDAYEQIKKRHEKIRLIYFTGDIIDLGIWETTVEGNKESIRKTMRKMKEIFDDVIVLPILGNHESQPVNVYSPDYVPQRLNTQWLYDFVAEEWSYWLPESTKETIKRGGYYTVLIQPGFRVIALNNNVMAAYNWWLYYETDSIKEQLQWLHDTLLQAEQDNEKVHILAHIPSVDDTNFFNWDREYGRIIEKRIRDLLRIIFFSQKLFQAISVAFNGGSVTAYSYGNPNYKVYDVEPQTYKILDHHTWTYNLTAANCCDKRPEWYKMYSFKQDFDVESLDPVVLDKLAQKMATDNELAQKYFEFSYRKGDITLAQECDRKCLQAHVCRIATTIPFDYSWCDEYIPK